MKFIGPGDRSIMDPPERGSQNEGFKFPVRPGLPPQYGGQLGAVQL
jgi:hypothetical protein